jgi:hypothetical protein
MFLQSKQSIDRNCVTYELRVARALMEDMRDITKFEGWFNVGSLVFCEDNKVAHDMIGLQPEGLAMQLLRLAYIAARHEEGPYGEPEELFKDTD